MNKGHRFSACQTTCVYVFMENERKRETGKDEHETCFFSSLRCSTLCEFVFVFGFDMHAGLYSNFTKMCRHNNPGIWLAFNQSRAHPIGMRKVLSDLLWRDQVNKRSSYFQTDRRSVGNQDAFSWMTFVNFVEAHANIGQLDLHMYGSGQEEGEFDVNWSLFSKRNPLSMISFWLRARVEEYFALAPALKWMQEKRLEAIQHWTAMIILIILIHPNDEMHHVQIPTKLTSTLEKSKRTRYEMMLFVDALQLLLDFGWLQWELIQTCLVMDWTELISKTNSIIVRFILDKVRMDHRTILH